MGSPVWVKNWEIMGVEEIVKFIGNGNWGWDDDERLGRRSDCVVGWLKKWVL